MGKLFWCSVAVAVAAAGSVYLASRPVERTPIAVLGQGLMALGAGAASSGSDQTVPLPDDPAAIPEPAAVGSPEIGPVPAPSEVVAVADASLPGQLRIGEGDALEPISTTGIVQFAGPVEPSTLVSPATQTSPAPAMMPYCRDDDETAGTKMPYADEDEQLQEAGESEVLRLLSEAFKEGIKEPAKPDATEAEEHQPCPQDQDYHRQYPCCPYTGHCYPSYPISPAAPEVKEEKKSNNETPKLHESKKQSGESLPEQTGSRDLRLDTMEFRPSDAGFQPFVTRPF